MSRGIFLIVNVRGSISVHGLAGFRDAILILIGNLNSPGLGPPEKEGGKNADN